MGRYWTYPHSNAMARISPTDRTSTGTSAEEEAGASGTAVMVVDEMPRA